MPPPVLILAFGNPMAGDDAFGSLVASQLTVLHDPRLHVVDLSRQSPSAMLDHLDSQPALVIIDAVTGPDIAPGQLIDMDWHDEARPDLVHDSALSTHGLSVANQLELAARLGMLPATIRLIGAAIADTAIGAAPSPHIPAAAAEAVQRILRLADQPKCHGLPSPDYRAARSAVGAVSRLVVVLLMISLLHGSCALAEDLISQLQRQSTEELIAQLGNSDKDYNHYVAMALWQKGEASIPALVAALKHADANTRGKAAWTLGCFKERANAAGPSLVPLLGDPEKTVRWYACQALGSTRGDPARAVPALAAILNDKDREIARMAAEALGEYGTQARPAAAQLFDALAADAGRDDWFGSEVIQALVNAQLQPLQTKQLSRTRLPEAGRAAQSLYVKLAQSPDLELMFLKNHPTLLAHVGESDPVSASLVCNAHPEYAALREYLLHRDDLPASALVAAQHPDGLRMLTQRRLKADSYDRFILDGAARALGEKPARTVTISATQPGDFKPASAAGVDDKRMTPDMHSHGDGITDIIITGRIRLSDGKPVINPALTSLNSSFAHSKGDSVPIKFDAKTGRFYCFTAVGAAHAMGAGQREPGPYQTGALKVRIDGANAKSLDVTFYDEMPDVDIILTPAAAALNVVGVVLAGLGGFYMVWSIRRRWPRKLPNSTPSVAARISDCEDSCYSPIRP